MIDISKVQINRIYGLQTLLGGFAPTFRFVHIKELDNTIKGKSYTQLFREGKTNCFDKTTIILEPCNIPLVFNNELVNYENYEAKEINPVSILDTGTSLQAGKTYYIYITSDKELICSLNSDAPTGYTTSNTQWLSSFHTVCANVGTISGHLLSGYNAGDILPNSISCISFRPRFADVDGMAYIDVIDKWCDIYLQSGTGLNTKSVFGATITDTRYYQNHVEDLFSVGKHLANDNEFTAYAFGSNQGTAISGNADPVTTGGHVDTAGRRMISVYGIEDCCGVLWQYLNSTGASGGSGWTVINTDMGKGSFYGGGFVLRAGGYWRDSSNCGVGSRNGDSSRAALGGGDSVRGLATNAKGFE